MDARVARRRVGRLRIGEDESQCDRVEGRTYDTLEVSLGGAPELEDAGASAARGLHAVRRGPLPLGEGGAAASGLTRRVRVSGLDAHLRPSPDARCASQRERLQNVRRATTWPARGCEPAPPTQFT